MSWALLIISKKVNLVENAASACFLISSQILNINSLLLKWAQVGAVLKLGRGCGTPPIFR
jgi:hypothetical protein